MFRKIVLVLIVPFLRPVRAKTDESILMTLYTGWNEPVDLEIEGNPSLYRIKACESVYTIFYQEDSTKINVITWEGEKSPEQVEREISSAKITGNHKVILKDSLTKLWALEIKNPPFWGIFLFIFKYYLWSDSPREEETGLFLSFFLIVYSCKVLLHDFFQKKYFLFFHKYNSSLSSINT